MIYRTYLNTDDIITHYSDLATGEELPLLEDLRNIATVLVSTYGTTQAYARALEDQADYKGLPFLAPCSKQRSQTVSSNETTNSDVMDVDDIEDMYAELDPTHGEVLTRILKHQNTYSDGMVLLEQQVTAPGTRAIPQNIVNAAMTPGGIDSGPKESPFKGDWPLANSIILIRDGVWFLEFCSAIACGDTGRAWEIMKVCCLHVLQVQLMMTTFQIWIFTFAGGGNSNYTTYFLETYCKIKYKLTPDSRDALFNNWLVNLVGKPGHFTEIDRMQEKHNLWMEELAVYQGKEFGSTFHRYVISMHVHHFLHLKEAFEDMVDLVPRRKTHGEPHLQNENREVLRILRERDLHRHHAGHDWGHHCCDHIMEGIHVLRKGKLKSFLDESMYERENATAIIDGNTTGENPLRYTQTVVYDDRIPTPSTT